MVRTCRACERWCCRPGKSTARHAACRDQAPTGRAAQVDCQSSAVHSPGAARTSPQSAPATHRHMRPFTSLQCFDPSVLCHCWLGGRKGIRPLKNWVVGAGVVICLERGADLHMSQLMPLPLTVSCFSKIQIGFTFLVPAHPGSIRKRAVKRVCVCVCVCYKSTGWAKKVGPHSWPNFCQILTDLKKFYRKIPR